MTHHPDAPDLPPALTAGIAARFQLNEYRVEGPLKVTGPARYTADLQPPGMLWAKFLVSLHAHAQILWVDVPAAASAGVRSILTGQDVAGKRFGRNVFDWPVPAHERVRFIGRAGGCRGRRYA